MHKRLITFILIMFFTSNTFAFSQKVKTKSIEKNYTQVTILDKGIKRKINLPKDDSLKNKFNPYSATQATSKDGVIISFKDPTQVSMMDFELKYGLKLNKKLVIGYYIFQNISKYSDIEIVKKIIQQETNVKTVKPNWKMKNKPR